MQHIQEPGKESQRVRLFPNAEFLFAFHANSLTENTKVKYIALHAFKKCISSTTRMVFLPNAMNLHASGQFSEKKPGKIES